MRNVHTSMTKELVFNYDEFVALLTLFGITATKYYSGSITDGQVKGPYVLVTSPTAQKVASSDSEYTQVLREVALTAPQSKFRILRRIYKARTLKKHLKYSLIIETNKQIKKERDEIEYRLSDILMCFYMKENRMNKITVEKKDNGDWALCYQPFDPKLRGFYVQEKDEWLQDAIKHFAELAAFLKDYSLQMV